MTDLTIKVLDKLDIIRNDFKDYIEELNTLKTICLEDKDLFILKEKYKSLESNPYSNEFKTVREELFSNYNFSSYNDKINELNLMILNINNRLKDLIPKGCGKICE